MLSLIHSSNIVHSYRCVIVAMTIGKLAGSTKDAQGFFITINSHNLRSYLKLIALFLLMKEMLKFWQLKCVRSAITFYLTMQTNIVRNEVRNEHPCNLIQSKVSISRNWKFFLFSAKGLGYTRKYLQKYGCSGQIQRGY